MSRFVILLSLAASAFAAQLSVKNATAHHVALAWTGTAASWTVERKAGEAQWQKVAASPATSYEDSAIDPWATYRYRVRANGEPVSNEVVVGPPPAGFLKPSPTPNGVDSNKYGVDTAVALDENGDPAIAFMWLDPNGDNDESDDEVRFVRWNRARYAWTEPVKLATVGAIQTQNVRPLSLAVDGATGMFGVAYPVAAQEGVVMLALSKDGGATWNAQPVSAQIKGGIWSTALAISKARAYMAVNSEGSAVEYLTADLNAKSPTWESKAAPLLPGAKFAPGTNVALVLDRTDSPLLAYILAPQDGDNIRFAVWRPGSEAALAMDSNNQGVDSPDVSLACGARGFGLLAAAPRDPKQSDFGVWYTASADGQKWSAPVMLPVDGPRSTNRPVSIALDTRGGAAAVYGSNSGGGNTHCGYPVTARSSDGAS